MGKHIVRSTGRLIKYLNAEHGGDVAAIKFDVHGHSKQLVLYSGDAAVRREAKQVALQYTWISAGRNGNTTLNHDKLDEVILALSDIELDAELNEKVIVRDAAHFTVEDLGEAVEQAVFAACGKRVVCGKVERDIRFTPMGLSVTVADDAETFRFWKYDSDRCNPATQYEALHLSAPYHPEHAGRTAAVIVNGDTSGVIKYEKLTKFGAVLVRLPSTESHPFKAEGKSFEIGLTDLLWHSAEAATEIAEIICAAFDTTSYVKVIGSFRAPLNLKERLEPTAKRVLGTRRELRGSENEALWEYLTLKEEGQLDGAHVPAWLHKEGWIAAVTS